MRLPHPQPGAFHLRQRLRPPLEGRRPARLHQLAEDLRVRAREQQPLMLRQRLANARARLRPLRLEKSAVEPDQEKQNPQAAEPEESRARESGPRKQSPRETELEKNEAPEPDRSKQNPRAVVLNFKENLLGQRGKLHLKQPIRAKGPGKAHKRGLTGSRKGQRACLLLRDLNNKE